MAGSKRFEIDLGVNASGAVRGTNDAAMAFEDLGDAVGDVADDSRDIGRGFKDAARDGKRSVEDLTDELRDAQRQTERLSDSADDFDVRGRKAFDRAADGVEEFKDEANSTAREAAASFDGSADSIADAFQEVAANAFAGFGPAGAVAGLAAAAGIGLAVSGFEAMDEAAKESQERADEWADSFIEAGGRVLTFEQTMAKVRDITTNRYTEAQKNAENWGVSIETATAAMAGLPSAIDEVSRSLKDQEKAAADGAVKIADGGEALADMIVGQTAAAREGRAAFEQLKDEMARGGEQASVFERLLADTARATDGATQKVDEFGDTIITLPDGKQVYIDAETGRATEDTQAIEDKIYGIQDKNVRVNVTADTSSAERQIARIINQGREIKIGTRIVGPAGGWDQ